MESWGEKLVELEERAKSNSHRISDLEADNKALHQLTASVQVLAAKQQTVEENVQEIKRDVKTLKNIPARRWEGVVRAVVTAAVRGSRSAARRPGFISGRRKMKIGASTR